MSSAYGAQLVGGASFLFSDTLGNHLLSMTAQANGSVRDVGAQAYYFNRENRWYWGIQGGVIPLASGSVSSGFTVLNGQTVFVQQIDLFRQTNTEVGFVTSYPISRATRVEFSSAVRHIGFTREVQQQVFNAVTGELLSDDKVMLMRQRRSGWSIRHRADSRYVGLRRRWARSRPTDTPRVSPAVGDLQLTTLNLDYRQYSCRNR